MSFAVPFGTPFNGSGGGTSTLVPFPWDCAINGRTYLFDDKYFESGKFQMSSIQLLKPQQASGAVGEDALNPADGIRAKVESWHHGAGQTYLDREGSDPYRFRASKGIDPWTKWVISLLPDTDEKRSSANTNLALQPAGARLYIADGQTLAYTTDVTAGTPSFTTVTATPAATVTGLASDGYNVWAAYTASGLYATNTGTGAASQLVTTALAADSSVGYVKGRLMVSKGPSIYNVTDLVGPAALPSALFTHPNAGFVWVGFAGGLSSIYAAGYAGDKSLIYRTTIKADGTSLDVPVVAGELPDGEIVRSIGSYLSLILIGTDKGWWVAEQSDSGDLVLNKVQDTDASVECFEGQGDFVWYGWTNYDSTSTGLGRADLRSDTKGASVLTPAYASDLMVTGQGAVTSVCTFQDIRVFAVSGDGFYAEDTNLVAVGTIDSGFITHGIPDDKVALSITLNHEPLAGTIDSSLSTDGETFTSIGSAATADSRSSYLSGQSLTGEAFEIRQVLNRDAVTTTGPQLKRVTLESNMAPGRGQRYSWALLFFDRMERNGTHFTFDPRERLSDLLSIEASGRPVTLQHALGSVTATLEDHDFIIEGWNKDRTAYVGTLLTEWRVPRSRN